MFFILFSSIVKGNEVYIFLENRNGSDLDMVCLALHFNGIKLVVIKWRNCPELSVERLVWSKSAREYGPTAS